jgi:Holliday junction resolvasome RuvABC endonuclease subunit
MQIIGLDPGSCGAAVLLREDGSTDIARFDKLTQTDIADALREWSQDACFAYLEKVHSMPKQGVSSTFKFGLNYGFLIGCLTALKIPFEFVTPNTWQKALSCQSKGDKNVTKAKAQQLFPHLKIIHTIADALLIAEYGRRTFTERNQPNGKEN